MFSRNLLRNKVNEVLFFLSIAYYESWYISLTQLLEISEKKKISHLSHNLRENLYSTMNINRVALEVNREKVARYISLHCQCLCIYNISGEKLNFGVNFAESGSKAVNFTLISGRRLGSS